MGNRIPRKVQGLQSGETIEAADTRERILLEKQAAQVREMGQAIDLRNSVRVEPQGLESCIRVQVLNSSETGKVKVQALIEVRRIVATMLFASDCDKS